MHRWHAPVGCAAKPDSIDVFNEFLGITPLFGGIQTQGV